MDVKSRIYAYKDELLERLSKLVEVNSVEGQASEDEPFGHGQKEALHIALKMIEDDHFKVVNLDNYIGYADFERL